MNYRLIQLKLSLNLFYGAERLRNFQKKVEFGRREKSILQSDKIMNCRVNGRSILFFEFLLDIGV